MATVTYVKPSGAEIEASNNPETKALAKELGWTRKKKAPPKTSIETTSELGDANA